MNTDEKRAFLVNHCKTLARALGAQGAYTAESALAHVCDGMMDYKIEDIFRAVFDDKAVDNRLALILDVVKMEERAARENRTKLGVRESSMTPVFSNTEYWNRKVTHTSSVRERVERIAHAGMVSRE